jgi:exonuclease SbcC
MRILSISLKNIKIHRAKELQFVSGINVLAGINGVGKSTIFEAIGYALFGVEARDFVGNIERFIAIGEKKGEIAVTFATDQGDIYRVSRGVGAGARWLLARKQGEAFEVEEHAGAQETESRIKELLGLDNARSLADQFKLVIGPFQHEFLGPFVLKQPLKRQEAFDEILGIDAWRKTYKGTSTLLRAAQNNIKVLDEGIKARQEQTSILPELKKELTSLQAELKKGKKCLTDKEKALQETEKQLADLDAREKTIATVKTEIQVLENRIRDGEGKISDQQKRVKEAEKAQAVLVKTMAGKEAFEAAERRLQSLRQHERQRRIVEKEIARLELESNRLLQAYTHEYREVEKTETQLTEEERQLDATCNTLVTADKKLGAMAARLPVLRQELEQIRSAQGVLAGKRAGLQEGKEKLAAGICPFFMEPCRNIANEPPQDVFGAKLEDLDQESDELEKRIAALSRECGQAEKAHQELDSLKGRVLELDKQLATLNKRRRENEKRRAGFAGLKKQQEEAEVKAGSRKKELMAFGDLDAEIANFEKVRLWHQKNRDEFFANQKDAGDIENRRKTLVAMSAMLEKLGKELAAKQQEHGRLEQNYDLKHHAEVRVKKEQALAGIAALRQQLEGLGKDRLRLEEEIAKLERIRREIEKKAASKKIMENKEALVKFMRNQVFNHVSAQLSERYRKEISLRGDRIYRTIADTDEELFWGDKYQIVLRDLHEGLIRERTDDQLSGGQIMSAVVALRLALLQTIGARIAFFDEPTSNLDAARRENLARAFRAIDIGREEVTEHWYDQLFLISHDVAFTEVTDQVITLE